MVVDIDKIKSILAKREVRAINKQKNSAVLIPLIWENDEWKIIFQKRSMDLKRQPGEISFPGGLREKGEDYSHTAIRETMEELNILEENISLIGELNYLILKDGSKIYSYLGLISGLNVDEIQPNKDEVDHLFTVSLSYFLNNEPETYILKSKHIPNSEFPYDLISNGSKYKFSGLENKVYLYRYGDYPIWGYTGEILYDFIKTIKNFS